MKKRVVACALILALGAVGGSAADGSRPEAFSEDDTTRWREASEPGGRPISSAQKIPLADQIEVFRNARRSLRELEPGNRQSLCSMLTMEAEALVGRQQELEGIERQLVELLRSHEQRPASLDAVTGRARELLGEIRPWARSLRFRGNEALCSAATPNDSTLSPGGTGGISGTVTDAGTAGALPGVYVNIFDSGGLYQAYGYTDASGNYSVTGLADGSYVALTANYDGYIDELHDNVPCPFGCTVTAGTAIVVSGGVATSGIDFALDLGGTLSGEVTDEATAGPVQGYVRLYGASGTFLISRYLFNYGRYEFDGLPAGTYFVRTDNSGGYFDELYDDLPCSGGCTVTSGTPVAVTLGASTTGIDFALVKGGTISGTIIDSATGISLAWNAQAVVFNATGTQVDSIYTNSHGSYISNKGLATGSYFVHTQNWIGWNDELYDDLPCTGGSCTVTNGTPVAVVTGTNTSGIDFALVNPGGVITGQVTDAVVGSAVPWVEIDIYDAAGALSAYGYTDTSGRYLSWDNLASGTYHARTSNYWGYPDELYDDIDCSGGCDPTTGTAIVVSSYTTGIDFGLEKSGAISGQITDATSSAPLAGFEVDIYDTGGYQVAYGYTDATGTYVSSGELAPGTYYAVTSNTVGYLDELYDNLACVPHYSCDPTTGTAIVVASYATGVDFALSLGGSVSGKVTQDGTGTPINGVRVQVYDSNGYSASQLTDASGTYSVFGLASGSHYACTSNDLGYVNERYDDMQVGTGWCNPTAGTPITVAAPADTGGIDFALALGGSISGTITEEGTGTPIADVNVYIYDSSGTYASGVETDSAGGYSASNLPTGTYFACAYDYYSNHIGERYDNIPIGLGWCDPTNGTPIAVTAPVDTAGIDFALALGGGISGTVTEDGTGTPIENVRVRIYDGGGNSISSDWTDSAGSYSFGSLSGGTYYACTSNTSGYINERYDDMPTGTGWCDPTSGTPIVVTPPVETGGIDFALVRGGSISGTVTVDGSGTPIQNVYLSIYDTSGNSVSYGYTDAAGSYTADRLPTGTYYACTSNSLGYLDERYDNVPYTSSCNPTAGTPIAVTAPADTAGIDFALGLGGSISGTVTEDGSGTPIPDVELDIYDSSGSYVSYAYTDATGAYMAEGLPTGTYYACAYEHYLGYINERYDNMPFTGWCNPTAGTAISVTAPANTAGIDFGLTKAGGISGTVTEDGTGTPIEDVDVNIYGSSGSYVTDADTNAAGVYAITGLPTGTYYACAYARDSGHIAERYDNMPIGGGGGCDPTSGTAIVVTAPNNTGGIDFALAPGASISGTVTEDGTGTPIENVYVPIYDSSGAFISSGYTDAAGGYSAGSLPTGTYYSCAYPSDSGHIAERYDGTATGANWCYPTSGTAIAVVAPATTAGIDYSLAPGGWISGSVHDLGTGAPVPTGGVEIYDAGGSYYSYGYPDASGNFSAGGLPTGTYYAVTDEWTGSYWNEAFHNLPCEPYCVSTDGLPLSVIQPTGTYGVDFVLQWLDGCRSDLLLDGPPSNDVGVNLEGCNSVEILGPFGVLAPGEVTFTSGNGISVGSGFFVDAGASAVFVSNATARWLKTIADDPASGLPGYVDVDAIRVSFVAPATLRIEFDMRGPLLPAGDPELGSVVYRAWVDLEPPFPNYADFADAEFAWEIQTDGSFNYVTAGPSVSPTVSIHGDRITLEADVAALAGATQFGLFVDVADFDATGSPFDQTSGRPISLPVP